jgi:hypothetical protein
VVGLLTQCEHSFETVGAELTSREEKYAAVLERTFEKRADSEVASVGAHEIRECTTVSRHHAYDLIDAVGTTLVGCEVRESDAVNYRNASSIERAGRRLCCRPESQATRAYFGLISIRRGNCCTN